MLLVRTFHLISLVWPPVSGSPPGGSEGATSDWEGPCQPIFTLGRRPITAARRVNTSLVQSTRARNAFRPPPGETATKAEWKLVRTLMWSATSPTCHVSHTPLPQPGEENTSSLSHTHAHGRTRTDTQTQQLRLKSKTYDHIYFIISLSIIYVEGSRQKKKKYFNEIKELSRFSFFSYLVSHLTAIARV